MILGTLRGGGVDGTLVVISRDRQRFVLPPAGPRTMQQALDGWEHHEGHLEDTFFELDDVTYGLPAAAATFSSPLPRAIQWVEGSCYLSHMERIRAGRGESLPAQHQDRPIVYQSGSDRHLDPEGSFALPDKSWELDIEATVVVVMGAVRVGASADEAVAGIRLVGMTNDLTYRRLLVEERRRGSGVYGSKPGRAHAPFLVSPKTLGSTWDDVLLRARMRCEINGQLLGDPRADRDISFDFRTVLAELTPQRGIEPGTIVGTGTVSNVDPAAGFACIAEKRGVEIGRDGEASTPFLRRGDRVLLEAIGDDGISLFGRIAQNVT